ncbi:hypothetical protein [Romboutsia sp.]|uniref:hypothetical protein n=1 Tax=Romboutsia sp. TaxID=1965302 RepID=UPI003F2DEEFB
MIKDKVKKLKFFICVNIILATIIGVYAQNITFYIVGDSLVRNPILYWLTILTVLSIALFVVTPIVIYRFIKKSSVEKRVFIPYLITNGLIGILTSMFSIFILVMSWG